MGQPKLNLTETEMKERKAIQTKKYMKKYNSKNKDKMKEYYEKNKDKIKENYEENKAQKRKAAIEYYYKKKAKKQKLMLGLYEEGQKVGDGAGVGERSEQGAEPPSLKRKMEKPLLVNTLENVKKTFQETLIHLEKPSSGDDDSIASFKFGSIYLVRHEFYLKFCCEFCGKQYGNLKDFIRDSLKHIMEETWEMNSNVLVERALDSKSKEESMPDDEYCSFAQEGSPSPEMSLSQLDETNETTFIDEIFIKEEPIASSSDNENELGDTSEQNMELDESKRSSSGLGFESESTKKLCNNERLNSKSHGGKNDLHCIECNKSFKNTSSLLGHKYRKHNYRNKSGTSGKPNDDKNNKKDNENQFEYEKISEAITEKDSTSRVSPTKEKQPSLNLQKSSMETSAANINSSEEQSKTGFLLQGINQNRLDLRDNTVFIENVNEIQMLDSETPNKVTGGEKAREEFYCNNCYTSFSTKATFNSHNCLSNKSNLKLLNLEEMDQKDVVKIPKDFTCLECNKGYSSKSALNMHNNRYHTTEGLPTSSTSSLQSHKHRHHASDSMERKMDLVGKQVKRYHHDSDSDNVYCSNDYVDIDSGKLDLSICSFCKETFPNQSQLKMHIQNFHSKKFKCEFCDTACFTERGLERHMQTHKELTYAERNDSFEKSGNLPEKSLEANQYVCEVCDQNLRNKKIFKDHMMRHRNERPFCCDICNKSFYNKGTLKSHRTIHSNERPYFCTDCGATFQYKRSLKTHMILHSDKRDFKCSYCDKAYVEAARLRYHIHLKHRCSLTDNVPELEKFASNGNDNADKSLQTKRT